MVQRKRKISEIENELKEKAINEVITLTNFDENMLNANILQENTNGTDYQITCINVETVPDNFDMTDNFNICSGCKELKLEVSDLKEKLNQFQLEVSDLKGNLNQFQLESNNSKEKTNRENQLLYLNDLGRMFRYYFADTIIKNKFNFENWGIFVEHVDDLEEKLQERKITDKEFHAFIDPINAELRLDIVTLIKFIQDRHSICHTDIRKKINQEKFLETLKNTDFYDDLRPVALEMMHQLEHASLRRMN